MMLSKDNNAINLFPEYKVEILCSFPNDYCYRIEVLRLIPTIRMLLIEFPPQFSDFQAN